MITRKDLIKFYWSLPRDIREKVWIVHGIGYNSKKMKVEKIHDRSKQKGKIMGTKNNIDGSILERFREAGIVEFE